LLTNIVLKFRRSFLLKTEITQQDKLIHSLTEPQDVLTSASSPTVPTRSSGLVKIAAAFGNHRRQTSAIVLGLTVVLGISSIPANYPDLVAAAESASTITTAISPQAGDLPAHSGHSADRYIQQLRSDVSQIRVQSSQPISGAIAQAYSPIRSYPSSAVDNSNSLQQSNADVSIPIEVAAPKIKTYKSAATTQPYYPATNMGSDGEFANPEDHLPTKTGVTNIGYSWPATGTLTSKFGRRWGRMHKGIDIAGPVGTPIDAAADGIVIAAGWNSGGYGNLVEIRHSDGTTTRYGHNSRLSVSVGQVVRQGQQVAQMGSTGHSTGSHLHFEIRPSGGSAVNPMAHLPANS
jgi:murein DD-endopeptidase MepM/ murein hydrolase activator NlpD